MTTFTIYGCNLGHACGNALALSLEPWPEPQTLSVNGGAPYTCDTSLSWDITAPDGAEIVADVSGVSVLRVDDVDHSANNAMALADLGLHGFAVSATAANGT